MIARRPPAPRLPLATIAGVSIRILIADDQQGIRSAFRMILDAQSDMTVVAEAADGHCGTAPPVFILERSGPPCSSRPSGPR
jgi:hypothetical protein